MRIRFSIFVFCLSNLLFEWSLEILCKNDQGVSPFWNFRQQSCGEAPEFFSETPPLLAVKLNYVHWKRRKELLKVKCFNNPQAQCESHDHWKSAKQLKKFFLKSSSCFCSLTGTVLTEQTEVSVPVGLVPSFTWGTSVPTVTGPTSFSGKCTDSIVYFGNKAVSLQRFQFLI